VFYELCCEINCFVRGVKNLQCLFPQFCVIAKVEDVAKFGYKFNMKIEM